ncbi:MAG TPA: hypothetical protein DC014_00425 [Treponema sp.]|nr:hypothetical protein [Treponema sp.]
MRICKKLAQTVSLASLCFVPLSGFAQSMPEMPSISMPEMPIITVGNTSVGANTSSQTKQNANSSSSTNTNTSSSNSSSASVTAKELQTLSQLGSLDTLSSLLGSGSSSNSLLSNLYGSNTQTNNTTNLLLTQILEELERLHEKENSQQNTEDSATSTDTEIEIAPVPATTEQSPAPSASVTKPRLLRFLVNGYNILNTCTNIYISSPEQDGTFLVSGDRRYNSDGKIRSETFHILFRTTGIENGLTSYSAASQVNQDYLNQYSFLYQMAQKQNLTATRTGNLVTLRTTDPNWKLELLIDLGTQE